MADPISKTGSPVGTGPVIIGLTLFFLLAAGFDFGKGDARAETVFPGLFLQVEGDMITLEADSVPLGRLTEALSAATGVRMILLGPRDGTVSIPRTTDNLEAVLKALAPEAGMARLYADDPEVPGGRVIRAVYLLSSGGVDIPHDVAGRPRAPGRHGPATEAATRITMQQLMDVFHRQMLYTLSEADLDLLEDILRHSQDPDLRLEAVFILSSIPDDSGRGIDLLVEAVSDPDMLISANAITALGGWGGERAMETLNQTLHHPDVEMRTNVMHAAMLMEPEFMISLARAGMADHDSMVRLAAIDALGNSYHMGGEVVALLNQALSDPDPDIQEVARFYLDMVDGTGY